MAKKSKRRQIGLYIFYGAVTVVFLLTLLFSNDDPSAIIDTIKTADIRYILAAFGAILGYLALYPLSLCILTRAGGNDISLLKTYVIAMTEHFFNGITPFATGGQPFQVYAFKRARVKAADSTCLLLMNFFVFMLVTNGFAACSLFYFKKFVTDTPMTVISIVGFSLNFTVLAFTVSIATSKRIRALLSAIVKKLAVWRLTKRFVAPRAESIDDYFLRVQTAFAALLKKKGAFLLALLTKACAMAFYYSTTFFILRALFVDVPPSDLFFIISGTSFAITMVVFLPTPGSSGGIEFAFRSVFASILVEHTVNSVDSIATGGMIIWRLLSYYLTMLISLVFYILLEFVFHRADKRERPRIADEA